MVQKNLVITILSNGSAYVRARLPELLPSPQFQRGDYVSIPREGVYRILDARPVRVRRRYTWGYRMQLRTNEYYEETRNVMELELLMFNNRRPPNDYLDWLFPDSGDADSIVAETPAPRFLRRRFLRHGMDIPLPPEDGEDTQPPDVPLDPLWVDAINEIITDCAFCNDMQQHTRDALKRCPRCKRKLT